MEGDDRATGAGAADAPIVFDRLTHHYGRKRVLHDLTLRVPRGSVFALLGRNGAGKTSAIGCLMGFLAPTRGRALLLGHDSTALPPGVRHRIGHVDEEQKLVPWMRLAHLLAYQAATVPGFDLDLCRRYLKALHLAGNPRVKELSRGQRAQVALALALAPRPEVVVFDDPALGLDAVARRELVEAMVDLAQEEQRTVLVTSHYLDDAERMADRVGILHAGVLRVNAPMAVLKDAFRRVTARFEGDLPALPPLDGVIRARERRGDLLLTVKGDGVAAAASMHALGAARVDVDVLPLEELFIDYTSSGTLEDRFLEARRA